MSKSPNGVSGGEDVSRVREMLRRFSTLDELTEALGELTPDEEEFLNELGSEPTQEEINDFMDSMGEDFLERMKQKVLDRIKESEGE